MQNFFVRHKLTVGDVTHLSDSDSRLIIAEGKLQIEDPVKIETYEKIFLAQVSDIQKNSVEIQIMEEIGERETAYIPSITIIQSLSNDSKFNYFIEKSVEIGIEKIIPIESKYSLKSKNKAVREYGFWNKLVRDATEQSRNTFPTIVERPIYLRELVKKEFPENSIFLCLATESIDSKFLTEAIEEENLNNPVYIAIGPEKGWHPSDLAIFEDLGFKFIKLKGNILRTETTGLVIGSIIKYLKGEI
jgi:16S rRNA (uracil1498-N3)-methyltransferase